MIAAPKFAKKAVFLVGKRPSKCKWRIKLRAGHTLWPGKWCGCFVYKLFPHCRIRHLVITCKHT